MSTDRQTHADPTHARELLDELEEEAAADAGNPGVDPATTEAGPSTSEEEDFAPDVQDAGEPPD